MLSTAVRPRQGYREEKAPGKLRVREYVVFTSANNALRCKNKDLLGRSQDLPLNFVPTSLGRRGVVEARRYQAPRAALRQNSAKRCYLETTADCAVVLVVLRWLPEVLRSSGGAGEHRVAVVLGNVICSFRKISFSDRSLRMPHGSSLSARSHERCDSRYNCNLQQ